jgi:hypothetical protein
MDFYIFIRLSSARGKSQILGKVKVQNLVAKAWSSIDGAKSNPMISQDPAFLFKFSPGSSQWVFARVELTCGDFPDEIVGCMAVLT